MAFPSKTAGWYLNLFYDSSSSILASTTSGVLVFKARNTQGSILKLFDVQRLSNNALEKSQPWKQVNGWCPVSPNIKVAKMISDSTC